MASEAIAAIATPPGRGGIGVVRVSGARLVGILRALTGKEIAPRYATRADFLDAGGGIIDQGLALYFPAPHSYTGEDVFELQAHGGPVVLQQLLRRCLELGARVAEPGEFTKRAFLNDKLDLAQAESVADLIDASTSAAARCAVRSLQGEFSRRIQTMVDALTDLRMLVEATLDFPEEDTATLAHETVGAKIDHIRGQLGAVLAASRQGSLLRAGLHIVIAGQPNVGKSSLVNRLAGEEVAIVSEIPGTTRDVIRQSIEIHGVPLHILDTAGLRESGDPLETIGISRAWENIAKADMVLWVSDATRPLTRIKDLALMERIPKGVPQIRVTNKTDLAAQNPRLEELPISAKTGAGIEALKNEILKAAGGHPTSEDAFLARERHLRALLEAASHLEQAACCINRPELVAEELRLAQAALGNITGEFTSDDLLGQIFSRFCIGK